jgi:hypothetical protein
LVLPPLKLFALLPALALLLAACASGERTSGSEAREESGAASASPSAVEEEVDEDAQATVRIYQLQLTTGTEKGGDRLRIMVNNATPDLRITLTGPIDQEGRSVTVCSVTDETSLPPSTQCVLPVSGRPVDLPAAPGIRGAEISLAGRSPLVDLDEIALSFTATDRRVKFLLPNLQPAPADATCAPRGCPSFEMNPARDGDLNATASWGEAGSALVDIRTAVPAPDTGTAATPPAYTVVSSATSASSAGPGSVSVGATLKAEDSSILALTNNGTGALLFPVLEATWP